MLMPVVIEEEIWVFDDVTSLIDGSLDENILNTSVEELARKQPVSRPSFGSRNEM